MNTINPNPQENNETIDFQEFPPAIPFEEFLASGYSIYDLTDVELDISYKDWAIRQDWIKEPFEERVTLECALWAKGRLMESVGRGIEKYRRNNF